jgi:hypothetical protein
MLFYSLGYGAYVGVWMFYTVWFFLTIQNRSPIMSPAIWSLSLLPESLPPVCSQKTLHIIPGHYILITSMVSFGLGPVFFLPQTPNTI